MSVALKNYNLYIETLNVTPGDDAQAVKKAFRLKIKKHHPDTATTPEDADRARTLIEAYEAFKKGVPEIKAPRLANNSGLLHKANLYRQPVHTKIKAKTTEEIGKETGKRIYNEVFAKRTEQFQNPFKHEDQGISWDSLSDLIWGDAKETQVYGNNVSVREVVHQKRNDKNEKYLYGKDTIVYDANHFKDKNIFHNSKNLLKTAEENLQDVVHYFDESRNRKFTRNWMKDYVAALNNVQIRFRDVSKRHPAFSARALRRVRQIGELISEIKTSVTR